ncbi:MAG: 3-isopropylmalate dehydratase [Deltaproteobacteria bacterium]|nr:3-isopropylmalate dehydratase [Deltaproteobacteria bacterium]
MEKTIVGKVFKMGDNINTDVIIPGKYLIYTEPAELAKYAFSVMGPEYTERLKQFDIIVAGENFGCGSAREQGATAIKGLKMKAVLARSFARIFYRNAINAGVPIVECPEAVDAVEEGDEISINFAEGKVKTPKGEFSFPPMPESIFEILEAGGLAEHLKATLNK